MKPFNDAGAFQVVNGADGLRQTAIRGAGLAMLSQSAGFGIQMVATVTLARLLAPKDFGLLVMVTTFSVLLASVGVNGFFEAAIQRPQINHVLASNLFWINVTVATVLTAGFAACGPLLSRFYGSPLLPRIATAMSATIFLSGFSGIHLALLKRGMQFGAISSIDVTARVASVATSVWLGWQGWGYWSLVAGAVVLQLSTSIGVLVRCRWIPGLPRRRVGTLSVVRFAMNTYGHFATNYCMRNLDNLLVGWFFGAQSLGLYKKAYDLCMLPMSQLSEPLHSVAVPTLSRLANDPEKHQRYVLRALSALAFIGMGLGACLTLIGRDVIRVLLGRQWQESGNIFTVFAPGIGALLIYSTYGWIHLSIGRADRLFRWGIVELCVIGSLFLLGARFGPSGVALAWTTAGWLLAVPALWYAGRPAGIGVGPMVAVVWKFIVASALAGVTSMLLVHVFAPVASPTMYNALARIVSVSLLFAVLYLAMVAAIHGGVAPLRQMVALSVDMLPGRISKLFKPASAFTGANV